MTVADKAAQLLVIPFYGDNPNPHSAMYRKFATRVQQLRVGGMILANRSSRGIVQYADPVASATFLNRMQALSRIPLIVGGDFERGVSMRILGSTKFPHSMAFAAARDLDASRSLGAITARESRAIGVHWIFAPVADVNNNPDNAIINIRSYSENPREVSNHVRAYIEGAHSDPLHKVLVTVKHFPGHGDTAVDTHLGLAKIGASSDRLTQLELVPFQEAIAANVDSIMTAHLWVPAIESQEIPATVSPAILTGLLRNKLGFTGIITTDAMDMLGLSRQFPAGEAAVRAIEAGVDVLLMPANAEQAVRGIVAAVKSGRLTEKRLDLSVEKLLRAKAALGLQNKKIVDVAKIARALSTTADEKLAQSVAEKAITLVRNDDALVPLQNAAQTCWFVLSESRYGEQGKQMVKEISARSSTAMPVVLYPDSTSTEIEAALQSAKQCRISVVAAFAGFRSNGSLSEGFNDFVTRLSESGSVILTGMGNPYLLRGYPKVQAFLATFSTTPPSESAAVRSLFGEIAIHGHLPVTIPTIAKYGDGLKTTAKHGTAF